jgi:hypothetical protein
MVTWSGEHSGCLHKLRSRGPFYSTFTMIDLVGVDSELGLY